MMSKTSICCGKVGLKIEVAVVVWFFEGFFVPLFSGGVLLLDQFFSTVLKASTCKRNVMWVMV